MAVAPESREANEALFQLLDATGQTRELRDALVAFPAHDPQERRCTTTSPTSTRCSKWTCTPRATRRSELLRAEPGSLPHRVTLALAELRLGNGLAALDTFRGLALPKRPPCCPGSGRCTPPRSGRRATSATRAEIARAIVPERLLPEERELIRPILEGAPPSS